MRVNRNTRVRYGAQSLLFSLLVLATAALLGWLSLQYHFESDWTYNRHNSLTPGSLNLLKTLDKPLTFTIYSNGTAQWQDSSQLRLLTLYQRAKSGTRIAFVNIDQDPQAARNQGITVNGELQVTYGDRDAKITNYQEGAVSNAIQQLARSTDRYLVFLTGDGERNPLGQRNFDLGTFGQQLEAKGFKLETLNLASNPSIPENTAVLVIAGPQAQVFPGAVRLVREYVKKGGNLLWLGDPGPLYGLELLAQDLSLRLGGGEIIDPESQVYGATDPRVVVVPSYSQTSDITRGFSIVTAFPEATSVNAVSGSPWQATPFLETPERSWLVAGSHPQDLNFDAKRGDARGPLTIGLSLSRKLEGGHEQRVVVTGNGEFLSNQVLGSGGNLQLGLNIFNWLSHDDSFINIDIQPSPDLNFTLLPVARAFIGFGFLLVLPAALIFTGIGVWLRRRRR